MKIKTMQGKTLDIGAIMAQNETTIALGNASMNARGDIIGPGGQVVKRKEQVAQEYHKRNPNAVKTVSLKELQPDVFLSPAEAVTEARKEIAAKQAIVTKGRKIVDSDE
jgi:hypothetical protein